MSYEANESKRRRRVIDKELHRLARATSAFDDMGSFNERIRAIYYLVARYLGITWLKQMPEPKEKGALR